MKCPACPDSTLLMAERQNVEIDYCPTCRGVWLDRGELDKLIQLGSAHDGAPPAARDTNGRDRPRFEDSDFRRSHHGHRRKSWLSEIFD